MGDNDPISYDDIDTVAAMLIRARDLLNEAKRAIDPVSRDCFCAEAWYYADKAERLAEALSPKVRH